MRAADVIDLIRGGELCVVDVTGEAGNDNGQLLELLRGLLDEA